MQDLKNLSQGDVELINIASEHAKKRYKKDFISIGAALRTKNGKIYTGTNTKYHVRNLSSCAEMTAIYKAIDDGIEELDTIVAVKYFPERNEFIVLNGCGKCRQLFMYHKPLKTITDDNGVLKIISVEELLPFAFI
ncbi:MAG: cytidine deaminase [bacterium]|nr:cytidine deaminase [bacterium]